MAGQVYIRELWDGKRNSLADHVLTAALSLLAIPYEAIVRCRANAYGAGIFPVHRLERPVISVGNLTVGGTGKTPMVLYLVRLLMERGKRVCVLSRGYGGTLSQEGGIVSDGKQISVTPAEAGDEPFLLAQSVPGLMVVVGADRYRAGLMAQERLNPDIFILDDGFQHIRLHRDLDILLLDSRRPYGNGRLLPSGSLREPLSALQRADITIFTRWKEGILLAETGLPCSRAVHRLSGFVSIKDGGQVSLTEIRGCRVAAFAGIAEPASFFDMLKGLGIELIAFKAFPDHVPYGDAEIEALVGMKETSGADLLVTTGKDAVKLAGGSIPCDILAAQLEMELLDPEPLQAVLAKLL